MLKTFSIGGVHPHENKLSAHQPIVTAEVPAKAVILLGQHIGAPAKPIVAKGGTHPPPESESNYPGGDVRLHRITDSIARIA